MSAFLNLGDKTKPQRSFIVFVWTIACKEEDILFPVLYLNCVQVFHLLEFMNVDNSLQVDSASA